MQKIRSHIIMFLACCFLCTFGLTFTQSQPNTEFSLAALKVKPEATMHKIVYSNEGDIDDRAALPGDAILAQLLSILNKNNIDRNEANKMLAFETLFGETTYKNGYLWFYAEEQQGLQWCTPAHSAFELLMNKVAPMRAGPSC